LGVRASAPAKVILFGEHFVVYGEPALVAAIDRRAYAEAEERKDELIRISSRDLGVSGVFHGGAFTPEVGGNPAEGVLRPIWVAVREAIRQSGAGVGVDVEVWSGIPVAAGLGSSAAVAAAAYTATAHLLGLRPSGDEVFKAALEAEKLVHGTPSGVDPAISAYGGVLLYSKGEGIRRLNVGMEIPMVIGNTGVERSTGALVSSVRSLRSRFPALVDPVIRLGGRLTLRALDALKAGDLETLGSLMNINHGLLWAVGVSHPKLDRLVHAALEAGALGAKLTGAGGGGCMIALARRESLRAVAGAIEDEGGVAIIAGKSDVGVRVES